ncbi:hypothetical protein [Moraxella cuniculi]|uniref:hypothetical protein n=1 Tax=Moraxella cuniculi TaxID=34061 RepID=UPI000970E63B|nr:hypothetical protein [Moraxella cuniculi]OOS02730.1 hypothetical protein B0189_09965 [Moraxella cuniculi]
MSNNAIVQKYAKLLRRRLFITFYLPTILLLGCLILNSLGIHGVLIAMLILPSLYVSLFWFMANNICPWCGESFFSFGFFGYKTSAVELLYAKRCQNCKEPKATKIDA